MNTPDNPVRHTPDAGPDAPTASPALPSVAVFTADRLDRELRIDAALRWAAAVVLIGGGVALAVGPVGPLGVGLGLLGLFVAWLMMAARNAWVLAQARRLQPLTANDPGAVEAALAALLQRRGLLRWARLTLYHTLASVRHRQQRFAEVAAIGSALLDQRLGPGEAARPHLLLLSAEARLACGDLAGAYIALGALHATKLNLAEALQRLAIQTRYELAVGELDAVLHEAVRKARLAELLPAPHHGLLHAALADAATRRGHPDLAKWLRDRAVLLCTAEQLAAAGHAWPAIVDPIPPDPMEAAREDEDRWDFRLLIGDFRLPRIKPGLPVRPDRKSKIRNRESEYDPPPMPKTSLASILPGTWFEPLPTLLLVVLAAAGLYAVIKGADWLVEGAAGLAKRLGMPEIIIGATIVSLGTTSPEVAVSVLAAFGGNAGLALGNAVGSIIADTGLIFGLGLILAGHLPADRFILNRQGWVQAGSAVLLAAMVYGAWLTQGDAAAITRWMGVLLVCLLVVYLVVSVRWAKIHPGGEPHLVAEADGSVHTDHEAKAPHSLAGLLMLGGAGLAVVIFAGDALVQSVTITAARIGVPDAVIASTIVALGTSLPELVTGITAIRKGHPELLVGNVIGADILNVLSVVGFSALAANLPVIEHQAAWPASHLFIVLAMPVMLVMLLLMRLYIFRATKRGHFDSWMGWPLLVLYVGFIVASYALSGAS